jgi:dihydroorotase-like cyclic amidohydrolase
MVVRVVARLAVQVLPETEEIAKFFRVLRVVTLCQIRRLMAEAAAELVRLDKTQQQRLRVTVETVFNQILLAHQHIEPEAVAVAII